MSIPIIFKPGRLLVGMRKRDWTKVWLTIIPAEEEDKPPRFEFTSDDQKVLWEDPRRAEIAWLPHYDPANCEANGIRAKASMQREFLKCAYEYMSEENPEVSEQMERDLHEPEFVRWQSWFGEAKKVKKQKLRARERRREGVKKCRNAGMSNEEIRDILDEQDFDSDDDSAIGESAYGDWAANGEDRLMPPPPKAPSSRRKRTSSADRTTSSGTSSKRTRVNHDDPEGRTFNGWRVSMVPSTTRDGTTPENDNRHDTRPSRHTNFTTGGGTLTPPPTQPNNLTNTYAYNFRRSPSRIPSAPSRSESRGISSPPSDHELPPNLAEQWDEYRKLNKGYDDDEALERARAESVSDPTPDAINGDRSEEQALRDALEANERENQKDRPMPSVESVEDDHFANGAGDGD